MEGAKVMQNHVNDKGEQKLNKEVQPNDDETKVTNSDANGRAVRDDDILYYIT